MINKEIIDFNHFLKIFTCDCDTEKSKNLQYSECMIVTIHLIDPIPRRRSSNGSHAKVVSRYDVYFRARSQNEKKVAQTLINRFT